MKRTIALIACLLPLLAGCTKIKKLSDYPFTSIDVSRICFDMVYLDIIPENNDFHYYVEFLEEKEYSQYSSEKALISAVDSRIKKEYKEEGWDKYISFEDLYLYKGAYDMNYMGVEPSTDYVVIAFGYNDDLTTMDHVSTARFRTPDKKATDLTVSVALEGADLTITPSNNTDKYFWQITTAKEVMDEYMESPVLYYYVMVIMYWEYEFFPGMEKTGVSDFRLDYYYDYEPGDQFYVVASGYDMGITTGFFSYKITYKGEDQPGIVEVVKDPFFGDTGETASQSVVPYRTMVEKMKMKNSVNK